MIGAEALNTAVEQAVDLSSPDRHPRARAAKDAAAGARFGLRRRGPSAWVACFPVRPSGPRLWTALLARPVWFAVIGGAAVLALWFIIGGGVKDDLKKGAKP